MSARAILPDPPVGTTDHFPRAKRRGFALLITVTLLAFLVLLLVSLASLTRVETRVAGNNQNLSQARQNALMALNIALGELQEHTGPDQRVTAPADIQIPDTAAIAPATSGEDALDVLDGYWAGPRNRRWTGSWKNVNTADPDDYDPNNAPAFNPRPGLQSWLVSGNENIPEPADPADADAGDRFVFKPTDIVTGLTPASTPLDEIMDEHGKAHRLLVKASAGVTATDPASLNRAVTAPQVRIESSSVPGGDGTPVTVGHYAWWVGDEGVKARANMIDPHRPPTGAAADHPENIKRRQSAQRPVIEAMTTDGLDGLAKLYPANDPTLAGIVAPAQLGFVGTDDSFQSELKTRYHDLTVTSRGVLADVRHGGLKRDLSYILSRATLTDFRTALKASSGYDPVPSGNWNPLISADSTPYAAFPDPVGTGAPAYVDTTGGIFDYSATWEQLWSFYNMGNDVGASPAGAFSAGAVTPRPSSATRQGIHPVLVQGKLFYRLRIADAPPDPDGVNRTGNIWVDVIPSVVLGNPYNVPLGPADYILTFADEAKPKLAFGTGSDFPGSFYLPRTDLKNSYTGDIQFVLKSTGFAPGEAKVFSLDKDLEIPRTTAAQKLAKAQMIEGFDTETNLSYDTGKTIPNVPVKMEPLPEVKNPPLVEKIPTQVGLYIHVSNMGAMLYMEDLTAPNLISLVSGRRPGTAEEAEANPEFGFLIHPISSGQWQGGGVFFALVDGASRSVQQAVFYQNNYRAPFLNYDGAGTLSSGQHAVPWVRVFAKTGLTGGNTDDPNPYLWANLMQDDRQSSRVRWGVLNRGGGTFADEVPVSLEGSAGSKNLLYDVPAPNRKITALGQLQHFDIGGHRTGQDTAKKAEKIYPVTVHTWQVNYPIGNSYPNPRVDRDRVLVSKKHYEYHYDGSYLLNDILWDRFYFSSYPDTGDFDFSEESLVNSRYKPFRDANQVAHDDEARFRGVYQAAENLLVDGAFNVNSTSVEAWKAVLSGLKDVPIGTETTAANLSAPFTRTISPAGNSLDAKAGNTDAAWSGFRNLTAREVHAIAQEMVLQVRLRGPFLSMAQFVNRHLPETPRRTGENDLFPTSDDPFDLGLRGALQAAIDKVINKNTDVAAPFNEPSDGKSTSKPTLAEVAYRMPTITSGFPGYLLQGDVLSAVGPNLAARSDTFTIRTYGDVVNPVTSVIEGRAWCEAVVQRTPDYVVSKNGSIGNDPDEAPTGDNVKFGRRYEIVSFRWLGPNDI